MEFRSRESLVRDPVTDMRGWGVHSQPAGTWSDDSSMALCILESILEKGWDIRDQGRRFVRWLVEGHLTAHGEVFDVGGATYEALNRIRSGLDPAEAGCTDEDSNGNGSLMRNLPGAVYLAAKSDRELTSGLSASSAVTHAHPRSRLSCLIHGLVAAELLADQAPEAARDGAARRLEALLQAGELEPGLAEEISTFHRTLSPELTSLPEKEIRSSGYVVHSLEASLWCLLNGSSFSQCVLEAVNLGEDTDTTAAVTGGLAGLYWGREAIPDRWIEALARGEEILAMAERATESW